LHLVCMYVCTTYVVLLCMYVMDSTSLGSYEIAPDEYSRLLVFEAWYNTVPRIPLTVPRCTCTGPTD